jgi:hypothetical protein
MPVIVYFLAVSLFVTMVLFGGEWVLQKIFPKK